jgi:hypothetical protein
LPGSHSIEATVIAEVRVDFDAVRPSTTADAGRHTPVPDDLAMTFDEVLTFIRASWHTTTHALLLAATPDPTRLVPAGASRIEIYIENERPETAAARRPAACSKWSTSHASAAHASPPRARITAGITTPTALTSSQIAAYAAAALDHIARSFGFTQVPGKDAPHLKTILMITT